MKLLGMVCALSLGLATQVEATSVSSLAAGGTLVQDDVVFSNFYFDDAFGNDGTGSDRQDQAIPGDRSVDGSEIAITTTSTANTVSLIATITPGISISGDANIFDFLLNFDVGLSRSSSRSISGITLSSGDIFGTGGGYSEVVFDVLGVGNTSDLLITEDPGFASTAATADSIALATSTPFSLEGSVMGDTTRGGMAGITSFMLTFDFGDTAPPPAAVPLPAGLWFLLTGVGALVLRSRLKAR